MLPVGEKIFWLLFSLPFRVSITKTVNPVENSLSSAMAEQVPRVQLEVKDAVEAEGKARLRKWLNMNFRIEMTDGRVLIGVFLCTDRDANVILGACSEYLKSSDGEATEEPRVLGLVMVPGRHIISIQIDDTATPQSYYYEESTQTVESV